MIYNRSILKVTKVALGKRIGNQNRVGVAGNSHVLLTPSSGVRVNFYFQRALKAHGN